MENIVPVLWFCCLTAINIVNSAVSSNKCTTLSTISWEISKWRLLPETEEKEYD